MQPLDFVILGAVAVLLIVAVCSMIRRKKRGQGCCGNCNNCPGCDRSGEKE